jgi:HAD superfamily hydrolase (TIGR01509 family)
VELSKIKVVSWDVDGTLYSLPAFMGALKWYLVRGCLSLRWVEVWTDFFLLLRFKRYMDKVRHAQGSYCIQGPVPRRERIAQTQHRIYRAILPRLGLLPGVRALLDWFDQQGLKQVVLSDYQTTSKLEALQVADCFATEYTGEQFDHLKPSPIVFHRMLEDLGIEPEELLHIGDRPDTDGAAAAAVGYQVAIIGRDFVSAEDLLIALRRVE